MRRVTDHFLHCHAHPTFIQQCTALPACCFTSRPGGRCPGGGDASPFHFRRSVGGGHSRSATAASYLKLNRLPPYCARRLWLLERLGYAADVRSKVADSLQRSYRTSISGIARGSISFKRSHAAHGSLREASISACRIAARASRTASSTSGALPEENASISMPSCSVHRESWRRSRPWR